MTFFDVLDRFVSDLKSSLKPEQVLKLKSCKSCTFYKNGYCTQAAPPFPILSEYYAQGCIYFSPEQSITGVQSQTSGTMSETPVPKVVSTLDSNVLAQLVQGISVSVISAVTVNLLQAIRDISWGPQSLIQNPFFTQGFTGWQTVGTVSIDNIVTRTLCPTCKMAVGGAIQQVFPIALNPSWWTTLYLWTYTDTAGDILSIYFYYTDGGTSQQNYTLSAASTWYQVTLTPTSGKIIARITFQNTSSSGNVWIDEITVVF